jgi:hypothetical protein
MKKKVVVSDKMQSGYEYFLEEKEGENFDKRFKPDLTPAEMLALGAFGGVYMRDCLAEFPESWFRDAKFQKNGINKQDPKLNYYKTRASQPLSVWRKNGWIHKDDPRGWFQWYCRYFMGRRHEDDERQIKRWQNMTRHVRGLQSACGVRGAQSCRPRQRQALLHWAYDSRKI